MNMISKPPAPAIYAGTQEGFGTIPPFRLYNLTANIPGHPAGSTVSDQTLLAAGYRLPVSVQARRQAAKNSHDPFYHENND